ncbi:MAG: NTP transferase domain-containing protein [Opitutales bacterium]|nr:NTP transferase domain-containing protein [Opitutales bacterium]
MVEKTLVILAAGRGSRFGGLKQLQTFQPQGATLVEYALWDAIQAGFQHFVAIVSADTQEAFQALWARWKLSSRSQCVRQTDEGIPKNWQWIRKKPWGTGQALYAVRMAIHTPFVLINADDFYGAEAYQCTASFFDKNSNEIACVGYPLETTLSPNGSVSRALCTIQNDYVVQMEEYEEIQRCGKTIEGVCGHQKVILDPRQPVSVNFFALRPTVFPFLEKQWERFLQQVTDPAQEEFYLPNAIQAIVREQNMPLQLLKNDNGRWFGMTYASDQARVQRMLFEETQKGHYPRSFF